MSFNKKWAKYLNRHFAKENMKMANKTMFNITNLSLSFLIYKIDRKLIPTSTICKVKYNSVYKSALQIVTDSGFPKSAPRICVFKDQRTRTITSIFFTNTMYHFFSKKNVPEKIIIYQNI